MAKTQVNTYLGVENNCIDLVGLRLEPKYTLKVGVGAIPWTKGVRN